MWVRQVAGQYANASTHCSYGRWDRYEIILQVLRTLQERWPLVSFSARNFFELNSILYQGRYLHFLIIKENFYESIIGIMNCSSGIQWMSFSFARGYINVLANDDLLFIGFIHLCVHTKMNLPAITSSFITKHYFRVLISISSFYF